jgi:hypothetical protein
MPGFLIGVFVLKINIMRPHTPVDQVSTDSDKFCYVVCPLRSFLENDDFNCQTQDMGKCQFLGPVQHPEAKR